MKSLLTEKSFTLIELVIVIGILAILAVVVIVAINPVEFLRQARDSNRLSDLQTINKALGLYESDGGSSFGSSNTVYVSIPDSSATCDNLSLPDLPAGWSYACSDEDNYRKIDGNGWIPADLTSISFGGSPLNVLPIDPINTTSSGNYYTYVTGGSWELATIFESEKYAIKAVQDGGLDIAAFEIGSNLNLSPFTHGLIGCWKFNEQSGTTVYDSSGFDNNGTMYSSSNPTYLISTSHCNSGTCISLNGVDEYVGISNLLSDIADQNLSISLWFYSNTSQPAKGLVTKRKNGGSGNNEFSVQVSISPNRILASADGAKTELTTDYIVNSLNHVVYVVDRINSTAKLYLNGSLVNSLNDFTAMDGWGNNFYITFGAFNYTGLAYPINGFFDGCIDDIFIYKRALSAAEISAIYNATK